MGHGGGVGVERGGVEGAEGVNERGETDEEGWVNIACHAPLPPIPHVTGQGLVSRSSRTCKQELVFWAIFFVTHFGSNSLILITQCIIIVE